MMRSLISNTDQAKVFLYDASDERIAVFECVTGSGASACATSSEREHWYVRDLDGKVLRSWEHRFQANGWTWREDNIFRTGQPLATLLNNGSGGENIRHLHVDHLGTPRQITDAIGLQVAFHSYYPFGEEATDPNQDPLRLKFTGHERDKNGGGEGQLDYMHARYESPMIGRFLSVDPIGGNPRIAQSWNRYGYVMGNPVNLVDPAGLFPGGFIDLFGGLLPVFDEITVTSTFRELDPIGFLSFLGSSGFLFNLDAITNGLPGVRGRITSNRLNNLSNAGNSFAMIATGRADPTVGPGPLPAANPLELGVFLGAFRLVLFARASVLPAGTTIIRGRQFGTHAINQMAGRGVPPSAVEGAIRRGASRPW